MHHLKSGSDFTIPNVLTFGRVLVSPIFAYNLAINPSVWLFPTLVLLLTDNLDGILARLGRRSPRLARYGLRESELGRKADPVADKIVISEMLIAGLVSSVIPWWLVLVSLVQKAAVSYQTYRFSKAGLKVAVSRLGKISEFTTNFGIILLFLAAVTDSISAELLGILVLCAGIVGASRAAYQYRIAAKQS